MEFNRQSIALLQQIKRLAKEEQGAIVHFDSPTLERDLRLLVKSGVSQALLQLIEQFLPSQPAPVALTEEPRRYRGQSAVLDDQKRTAQRQQRIYRGQVVYS